MSSVLRGTCVCPRAPNNQMHRVSCRAARCNTRCYVIAVDPAVCGAARSCGTHHPVVDTSHQTSGSDAARACTIILSFDVIGVRGGRARGTDAARVTLQGRVVEKIDCLRATGSNQRSAARDDDMLSCTAICGRWIVGSKQAKLAVTLLSASKRAISSPHIIPFLLLFSSNGSTGDGARVSGGVYRISVLPLRLLHGTCQHS